MARCKKCGNISKEKDKVIWKCNFCAKSYPILLSDVLKVVEKQKNSNVNSIMKCKECGKYLDDGNENIYWKCSCGNIQVCNLDDLIEVGADILDKSPMDREEEGLLCVNCGRKSPYGSWFCTNCGTRFHFGSLDHGKIKRKKRMKSGIIVVLAILMGLFIVNSIQSSNLRKELLRDWSTVEGEDGVYILCILDFSEDEIEYKIETGYSWMDTTVATYSYKVISGNKIKVNMYGDKWKTVTVEFNKEKTMMTLSPALTGVESNERWFNTD